MVMLMFSSYSESLSWCIALEESFGLAWPILAGMAPFHPLRGGLLRAMASGLSEHQLAKCRSCSICCWQRPSRSECRSPLLELLLFEVVVLAVLAVLAVLRFVIWPWRLFANCLSPRFLSGCGYGYGVLSC